MPIDKKIYVIVSVTSQGKTIPSFSIEPEGVYSTLDKALNYVQELEDNKTGSSFSETEYDVLEYKIDEEPSVLNFLKKEKEILLSNIEDTIIKLMKKGYIDQLVGEDGYFYYQLTETGKAFSKSIPEQIKKFFKKED